jgi:hypothetical protein
LTTLFSLFAYPFFLSFLHHHEKKKRETDVPMKKFENFAVMTQRIDDALSFARFFKTALKFKLILTFELRVMFSRPEKVDIQNDVEMMQ